MGGTGEERYRCRDRGWIYRWREGYVDGGIGGGRDRGERDRGGIGG